MSWKNTPLKSFIFTSIAINLTTIIIIMVTIWIKILPPVVPLFYGLPTGANQIVKNWELLIAPLSALIITFINFFLTYITRDLYLKKTLIVSATFISALSIITIIKIVLLVGFF